MGLAIVPGSFDPVTWGHVDIIRRAARLFDRVIALVMVNDQKQALFTPEERLYMLRESVRGIQRVEADFYGGMTYYYIARHGVDAIVKGLRDGADFAYECQIAQFNRQHAPQADTLFLLADPQRQALSSSWVKRAYVAGEEIRDAVPPVVLAMLAKKLPINKTKESEDRGMEHGRKCN